MRARSPRQADDGQAAIELALSLPIVVLVLLGAVQVVLVARDQLAVVHAAREAARAAVVAGATAADGVVAGERSSGLPAERLRIDVDIGPELVRAVVHYRSSTDVPLAGALVGDVDLTSAVVMRREP